MQLVDYSLRSGHFVTSTLTFVLKWSIKPLKTGMSEHRTISAHDLSVSQPLVGLGKGFSKATPPVSRNLHSWSFSSPLKMNEMIEKLQSIAHQGLKFEMSCVRTCCSHKHSSRTSAWATSTAWATALMRWTYFFPREWGDVHAKLNLRELCMQASNCSRQISIPVNSIPSCFSDHMAHGFEPFLKSWIRLCSITTLFGVF